MREDQIKRAWETSLLLQKIFDLKPFAWEEGVSRDVHHIPFLVFFPEMKFLYQQLDSARLDQIYNNLTTALRGFPWPELRPYLVQAWYKLVAEYPADNRATMLADYPHLFYFLVKCNAVIGFGRVYLEYIQSDRCKYEDQLSPLSRVFDLMGQQERLDQEDELFLIDLIENFPREEFNKRTWMRVGNLLKLIHQSLTVRRALENKLRT